MKNAIIVGASSGIGRALAVELNRHGYRLGLMARRENLLEELRHELGGNAVIKVCDVSQPDAARIALGELIEELGGLDLMVINAGVGYVSPDLNWEQEAETVLVNVVGFTALANAAYNYFVKQGRGHIVGISSVAALVAHSDAPAYNASKAFVSLYLACLRQKARKARLPITITDIKPGFVDTVMGQSSKRFWVATADTAAKQIMRAIERRANHAYVTRRWRLVGWLLKAIPEPVTRRLG